MTDYNKIKKWEEICLKYGYSLVNEVDNWLDQNNVEFTLNGSSVPMQIYIINDEDFLMNFIQDLDEEHLATLIIEFLSGMLLLKTKNLENIFWNYIINYFKNSEITIPPEIIPTYIDV